ncbi:MAG: hypothetical protein WDZ51_17290 [Pirellulaceae bacterium]
MAEFEFTLILSGLTDFDDAMVDQLVEAGCDDATVAQRYGRVYITFARETSSHQEAILTAIRDIHRANIGATVMRIEDCNLITPAEIARRLGRSRQNLDQYIKGTRGPGGFPAPACNITEGAPLYYWCEVAFWANLHDLLSDQANIQAQEIATINTILELSHQQRIVPTIAEKLIREMQICAPIDCGPTS